MPLIVQKVVSNARSTQITISKGVRDPTVPPKLYKANMKPLPHQQDVVNHFSSPAFISPMWMLFRVGSGKSLCALFCALQLPQMGIRSPKVTVICDVSLIVQWTSVIKKLHTPPGFTFTVLGFAQYEKMCKEKDVDLKHQDLVVVDEAQCFRNLSQRMKDMVDGIRKCKRVLLLSGTPIVNSAEDCVGFEYLCDPHAKSLKQAAAGRVALYNPEKFQCFASMYPSKKVHTVEVPMSWAQTLVYCANMHNDFKLTLDGERWSVTRPVNNRYNVALVSALNMPFEDAILSPKLMALAKNVASAAKPCVVYSARIEKGVEPILELLKQTTELKIQCIDGSTPAKKRGDIVKSYNEGRVDVLIISPASARGIDLLKTGSFHVLEPHQNVSEEQQTLARAVRYKSHMGIENACVHIYHYICKFPTSVSKPTPADSKLMVAQLQQIYGPECMYSATDIMKALKPLIASLKKTNDELQSTHNVMKHKEVTQCMSIIESQSIPMPLTEASVQKKCPLPMMPDATEDDAVDERSTKEVQVKSSKAQVKSSKAQVKSSKAPTGTTKSKASLKLAVAVKPATASKSASLKTSRTTARVIWGRPTPL